MKVLLEQVGRYRQAMAAVGGRGTEAACGDAAEAMPPHQTLDSAAADGAALGAQGSPVGFADISPTDRAKPDGRAGCHSDHDAGQAGRQRTAASSCRLAAERGLSGRPRQA